MKTWKTKIHLITEEFFQFSLLTYLILLLLEALQEGFVSFFFNLNILLCVVLVSGILMVLTHSEKIKTAYAIYKINFSDIFFLLFVTALGAFFIYYKMHLFGPLGIIVTILFVMIIFLLSLLLLKKHK